MKTKLYVAYGSNLNKSQMSHRCPKAIVVETGFINDFRLTFRGSGVANIEFSKGSKVPVVVWSITESCEEELDRYEGYPILYVKKDISVETSTGTIIAMVYVIARKYENCPALPNSYYLKVIQDGYIQNNLPQKYLQEALNHCNAEIDEI